MGFSKKNSDFNCTDSIKLTHSLLITVCHQNSIIKIFDSNTYRKLADLKGSNFRGQL